MLISFTAAVFRKGCFFNLLAFTDSTRTTINEAVSPTKFSIKFQKRIFCQNISEVITNSISDDTVNSILNSSSNSDPENENVDLPNISANRVNYVLSNFCVEIQDNVYIVIIKSIINYCTAATCIIMYYCNLIYYCMCSVNLQDVNVLQSVVNKLEKELFFNLLATLKTL